MRRKNFKRKKFKIKEIIKNIFVSFIIFLLFLAIVEVILRTTHLFNARISWSEPDSVLGYRFTPGRKYWFNEENDHPITGVINSYGWRDKDWLFKKPQNIYRIAVLGDSFVEAFQVESDRTFLALAEQQLNKNQKIKVELMNFGCSGYTQTEELIVLKNYVKQFSPDMVVLFFFAENDIEDISRETAPNLLRPFYHISENDELILDTSFVETGEFKVKTCVNWLKQHSALISLLCERYNLYKRQKRAKTHNMAIVEKGETAPKKIEGPLSLCTNNPDSTYWKNYQFNKVLIKAMSEYCKEERIRFMLVTININAYIPEVERQYKLIDSTFNRNFFEDDSRDFARSINVDYLGLQRIFRQSFENTGVYLRWRPGHWNYEGHKVVADALTNKLNSILYSDKQNNKESVK